MYEIEISKNELDTILMALKNTKERLTEQATQLSRSYYDLPPNLKFLWRDKVAYDKYKDDTIHECCRMVDDITKIEEKLEEQI